LKGRTKKLTQKPTTRGVSEAHEADSKQTQAHSHALNQSKCDVKQAVAQRVARTSVHFVMSPSLCDGDGGSWLFEPACCNDTLVSFVMNTGGLAPPLSTETHCNLIQIIKAHEAGRNTKLLQRDQSGH